jgi:asparagine synthase (glutamine-hydrolysing)
MCGILGQLNRGRAVNKDSFTCMLDSLSKRGPDAWGINSFNSDTVYLGHRRLSIIDLSDQGVQPMTNEDGTIWLTFNGEIYNYRPLKKELIDLGHVFKSNTDSEVIIHSFEEWGEGCVKKFRGVFSFGIYDMKSNSLFLARDHVGVKPLYYFNNNETFIFSSEPKAILGWAGFKREIDRSALSLYLSYGNLPGEYSIYNGIKKLLPGHSMLIVNGKIERITQYWKLNYQPQIFNEKEALSLLTAKLEECIELQTVSDVPVGILLSGGIDSTIITSYLIGVLPYTPSTFNIGFDATESDESQFAQLIAKTYNTNHYHEEINSSLAFSQLDELVEIFDEPFHMNGLFPYLALSKLVKKQGYKVVMGGDGADEIFAGYLWYDRFRDYSRKTFKNKIKERLGLTTYLSDKDLQQYATYNGFLFEVLQKELTGSFSSSNVYSVLAKHWYSEYESTLAGQFLDFNCFMPDHCLTKVDRVSMAQGVEVRVPFLDIELIDLVFKIDHKINYKYNHRKWLLKKSMENYLPDAMDKTRKKGFSSPLQKWLYSGGLSVAGCELLNDGSLVQRGVIDRDKLIANYLRLDASKQLLLIGLELWSRRWMENEKNPAQLMNLSEMQFN